MPGIAPVEAKPWHVRLVGTGTAWFVALAFGWLAVGLGVEHRLHVFELHVFEAAFAQLAAGGHEFLMQAIATPANDHDPAEREHGGRIEHRGRNDAARNAMQIAVRPGRPDFRAKESKAALHQRVVQVHEHQVVRVLPRSVGIERDAAWLLRVRMLEALSTRGPCPGKGWHSERWRADVRRRD